MSDDCCSNDAERAATGDPGRERLVLWIALVINAGMFAVELIAGGHAGSSSVQADSVDFLADAANYAVSLAVVGAIASRRAKAAALKGVSMAMLGFGILVVTIVRAIQGELPRAEIMGVIGVAAVAANLLVLWLLLAFRHGDANRRSVWICTRNDVAGNLAVLIAASGVVATRSVWPDAIVAFGMAILAIQSGWQITGAARQEMESARRAAAFRGMDPDEPRLT